MNLPNKLSLLRVALIPVMVALMYPNTPVCNTLATIVFALAAFTDSTAPNSLPAVSSSPSAGMST